MNTFWPISNVFVCTKDSIPINETSWATHQKAYASKGTALRPSLEGAARVWRHPATLAAPPSPAARRQSPALEDIRKYTASVTITSIVPSAGRRAEFPRRTLSGFLCDCYGASFLHSAARGKRGKWSINFYCTRKYIFLLSGKHFRAGLPCHEWRLSVKVPAGSLSPGGTLWFVFNKNQPSLPTSFYSVLVSISVFMTLSPVFHSINSPDNSPLSHSVLSVLFLPHWAFQLYISLWKSPSALI